MALLLIALFVVVPAVEIYVLIQVGHAIGAAATVALLLADAALGAALSRREGRKAWRALRTALAEQRLPAREVVDGALVVLGGAFLLTPGFVTDVIGVLCLLPPTRAILRRALTGVATRRLLGRTRPSGRPSYDMVEGEVLREQ